MSRYDYEDYTLLVFKIGKGPTDVIKYPVEDDDLDISVEEIVKKSLDYARADLKQSKMHTRIDTIFDSEHYKQKRYNVISWIKDSWVGAKPTEKIGDFVRQEKVESSNNQYQRIDIKFARPGAFGGNGYANIG